MKRISLMLLCALLLLSGCKSQAQKIETPVQFYYLRNSITYGDADSVLTFEERESAGYEQDYAHLLSLYFEGPESPELYTRFPAKTALCSITIQEDRAILVLSNAFANSRGMDLTLNCACIAKTCMALTGVAQVELRCESAPLGDAGVIVMDEQTLILFDDAGASPVK